MLRFISCLAALAAVVGAAPAAAYEVSLKPYDGKRAARFVVPGSNAARMTISCVDFDRPAWAVYAFAPAGRVKASARRGGLAWINREGQPVGAEFTFTVSLERGETVMGLDADASRDFVVAADQAARETDAVLAAFSGVVFELRSDEARRALARASDWCSRR